MKTKVLICTGTRISDLESDISAKSKGKMVLSASAVSVLPETRRLVVTIVVNEENDDTKSKCSCEGGRGA